MESPVKTPAQDSSQHPQQDRVKLENSQERHNGLPPPQPAHNPHTSDVVNSKLHNSPPEPKDTAMADAEGHQPAAIDHDHEMLDADQSESRPDAAKPSAGKSPPATETPAGVPASTSTEQQPSDERPLSGAGSAGASLGKPKGHTEAKATKQATLDFSRGAIALSVGDAKNAPAQHTAPAAKTSHKNTLWVKFPVQKDVLHKIEQTAPAPKRKPKRKPSTFGKDITRTTIIIDTSKATRNNPGPLLPLTYDLYDDALVGQPANAAAAAEKLALGFPVTHEPSSFDIAFIIAYLLKFEAVLELGPLGPDDFETGLRLTQDGARVSPAMDTVFRKLLGLVLNRKKPITREGQRPAIQELRAKYISFGLPIEWRDDTAIFSAKEIPCNPAADRVDKSAPEISADEFVEYEGPAELMNPFHEEDFENHGLSGIANPRDRSILLRIMATWTLSFSTAIKKYLVNVVNNQEVPGERDIYYGARAVLKSFVRTKELKREIDLKRAKKGKRNQPTDPTFDPTADPLQHPMALRLNEFVVGDCGFRIGRFYLVRMADQSSGRVASIDQMRNLSDVGAVRSSVPSGFRLYVEDVRASLGEAFEEFGVEFDSKGREVKHTKKYDASRHWHIVASTAAELEAFLSHLSAKLGLREAESPLGKSCAAYKPVLHMYQYLTLMAPVLAEYEKLNMLGSSESRTSRRRKVDYAAQPTWDEEYHEEQKEGKDGDYSDGEVEEDGEEDYVV